MNGPAATDPAATDAAATDVVAIDPAVTGPAATVAACGLCGRSRAEEPPLAALAWVSETERGQTRWLCGTCARAHVRDIEGKLPAEYW